MPTRPAHSSVLLHALTLAACAAAPQKAPPDPALLPDLPADAFPAAAAIVEGFDPVPGDASWESSDRVLFGLRLRRGAEEQRWLLRLDVVIGETMRNFAATYTDPSGVERTKHTDAMAVLFPQRSWPYTATLDGQTSEHEVRASMMMVGVGVFDAETGVELGKSVVRLPLELLRSGLLPAAVSASARRARGEASDEPTEVRLQQVRQEVEAWIATVALLHVVQEDSVLADYFWQVVEKPGIWSVLTHLGVSVTIDVQFENAVPATAVPSHQPRGGDEMVVPVAILVNGAPALFADALVGSSDRPYALCGGLRAAVARCPSRDDLAFDLVLLAARNRTASTVPGAAPEGRGPATTPAGATAR
ncbi:MAG: hypothetical protein AB7O97_08275 [Planctomycetota bacterium]